MESFQETNYLNEPTPRPEVAGMKAYSAPLEGRRKLLRLDFNENTIGPSPAVVKALQKIAASHISIYPEYEGLREAVIKNLKAKGEAVDLTPSHIGIFNGVDAAIHAIFHAYGERGDQLLTTTPTFGYYKPCALMQGMETLAIPYEGDDFKFPLQKIQSALERFTPKLLLICNPNNPTGSRLEAGRILELSRNAPRTLIVIDELYEAFTGDGVLATADFKNNPNLLVLRSLSKTAGLAGLRIGFAIGNPNVVEAVSRVTGPYDINSFAVTAALAGLADQAYIDQYVAEISKARAWIKNQLILSGIKHHIDGGNYFLIWPNNESSIVESSLRNRGILVRTMTGKDLIEGSIRVTIGTISQMKVFWNTYTSIDAI